VTPLVLTSFTAVNALGRGNAAVLEALTAARTGLKPCTSSRCSLKPTLAKSRDLDDLRVCERLAEFDCRNNRLAELALEQDGFAARIAQARAKYGARRIAVILGTSTSGILETEHAYGSATRRPARSRPASASRPRIIFMPAPTSCAVISASKARPPWYPPPARRVPRCSPAPGA